MTADLSKKHCAPCEGGTPPLSNESADKLLREIGGNWNIDGKSIKKNYSFKNFVQAVDFINKIADIAQVEGHHPDIFLHNYNQITITLSTHAIGGLSENDFIVAAKLDQIY